jgi:hypothetical protein
MTAHIVTYRHHCEVPTARPAPHALIIETRPEFVHAAAERAIAKRHGHGVYVVADVLPVPVVGDTVTWEAFDPWGGRHDARGILREIGPEQDAAGGGRFRFVKVEPVDPPAQLVEFYLPGRTLTMAQAYARPVLEPAT